MTKRFVSLFVITLLMVALLAMLVQASTRPEVRKIDPRIAYVNKYAITPIAGADEQSNGASGKSTGAASLGQLNPNVSPSPGFTVETSYRDQMHNSTVHRMVDWRTYPYVHFSYTILPAPNFDNAFYGYNVYDPISGTWPQGAGTGTALQVSGEYGAYPNLDVDPVDGAAVITGHDRHSATPGYHVHTYWDNPAMAGYFQGLPVPDTMALRISIGTKTNQLLWPKLEYQVIGGTAVTHVVAYQAGSAVAWGAIGYYRKVGAKQVGTWTGQLIDSACNGVSVTLTASRKTQKMAICWTMNTPYSQTIQGNNQLDNDVWYRMSTDMGASFAAKVNVTKYPEPAAGYRAYAELDALFASDDKLHIVWPARVWPKNAWTDPAATISYDCRLMHWSENYPTTFSTVTSAEWIPEKCNGGAWMMNLAKASFSECNGKLYAIYTLFNDKDAGVMDDCANLDLTNAVGAANGEIYMSVSSDLNGLTWDQRRDLTNSRTPNCDTLNGAVGPCDADGWSTVSRFGMDVDSMATFVGSSLTWEAQARTVFPSYTGKKFIHIQYINDKFPGNIVAPEGIFTRNPVKWLMIPCMDPVPNPVLTVSPKGIAYPSWVKNGQQSVQTLTLENTGNVTLNITTIGRVQTSPATPTWLATSSNGGLTLPAGIGNTTTMTVTLNAGGIINNPGTVTNLKGLVYLKSNSPVPLDSQNYTIDLPVADTLLGVTTDTVATACTRLAVKSNGNMGSEGVGKANMDYFLFGDCDTMNATDSIVGNSAIYLYDGSPVVLQHKTSPADTIIASWAIFGSGFATAHGFKPVKDNSAPNFVSGKTTATDKQVFTSGQFVTIDSSLAIEKTWYAPLNAGDSCNFIIQKMQIFPNKGVAVPGLTIGEAIDWDIPSDTASLNVGGFDAARNLIYQKGVKRSPARAGTYPCVDNSTRYGGMSLISYHTALDTTPKFDLYGGYTAANKDFVYPANGFVPRELWTNMQLPGLSSYVGTEDLHAVLTYKKDYTLAAKDTLTIWTALATVKTGTLAMTSEDASLGGLQSTIDKANAWYLKHALTCCTAPTTGDVDASGGVDISDLSGMVDYLFNSLPFPGTCFVEQDVDKSGSIDISDLQAIIDYLFNSIPLPNCG